MKLKYDRGKYKFFQLTSWLLNKKKHRDQKLIYEAVQKSSWLLDTTLFISLGDFPIRVYLYKHGNQFAYSGKRSNCFEPVVTIDYNYHLGQYEICSPVCEDTTTFDSSLYSRKETKSWIVLYTQWTVRAYDKTT